MSKHFIERGLIYMPCSKLSKKNNNASGFTVIELMVVIAIIAILGLVSMGPMLRWRANSQVESNTNQIMSDLERAKVEAIRRSRNVSLTFPTNATTDYHCYIDVNGNRSFDASEDVILFSRSNGTLFNLNLTVSNSSGTLTNAGSIERGFTFTPRGFLFRTNTGEIVITNTNNAANLRSTININPIGNITRTAVRY